MLQIILMQIACYPLYLGSVHLKSVGGGGACKFRIGFGGPSKFRIGFGGGHVNSAYVEKSL